MADRDLRRLRENLQGEIDSAALYDTLADVEASEQLSEVYRRMARIEEHHARFWEAQIRRRGARVPRLRPSWRSRALARLAHWFGAGFVLPTVVGMEATDGQSYSQQPESRDSTLPMEEHSHRRMLNAIMGVGRGMEGSTIAQAEGRHHGVGGNALRAAVLGANDGLVSNLSLVMGVAGAAVGSSTVLLTGLAGLIAGAVSMAMGEWLSVKSSRELYEQQIQVEAEELAEMPEEEQQELALIYQAKGLPKDQAEAFAARIIADRDNALDTLAREELGIDPDELGGSAWSAAATSFFLFAGGAFLPVFPFLFLTGWHATAVSVAASAVGLFGIGAAITLLTGRSVLFSGVRQLIFGLGAAAVTYGIGWMLGVAIAG
ncbi:MAG TPA: VIT1/CCC1 family protein [Gammaproteobacteria bacterium]|nr:VIT1/CCC1 family protein [Gammaproteobacteria bacterium]